MPKKTSIVKVLRGYLETKQINRFLEACDASDRLFYLLMTDCGLRMAEAKSVTWSQLFPNCEPVPADMITIVGKGSKRRVVPTTARLRRELIKFLDDGLMPALAKWGTKGPGQGYTHRRWQQNFKVRASRSGVLVPRLCPHSLRHSYATRMLKADVDLITVSQLLGHCNPHVTLGYLHVVASLAGAAAKLDAADG